MLITADCLTKTYRGGLKPAVDGISITVSGGEVIALVGHNGAGKSTLFDLLGGLIKPDGGNLKRQVSQADIGWCPQREIIDWSLTVEQNIALGLELRRGSTSDTKSMVSDVCDLMGLAQYRSRQAETLSGGELRRTQIARALAGRPSLIILDEPTNGLDPDGVRTVFEHIAACAAAGQAAIVSTHDTSRFASYCTRVVALRNGRVIADLPVTDFMAVLGSGPQDDLWLAYRHRVDSDETP